MSNERGSKQAAKPVQPSSYEFITKQEPIESCMATANRDSAMYELEATADMLLRTPEAKTSIEPSGETTLEVVLVKAVLEGDRDVFGRLYVLYAPLVHGILLARVPRAEVEDLVQDIFLHALRKLHTLRDSAATDSSISRATEILDLIRGLPEAYRETLVLRLVEGMTGPEIAGRTGLTPASVRVNLHRGMKLLREKLGSKEGL